MTALNEALELVRMANARHLRQLAEEFGLPAAKAIQKLEFIANNPKTDLIKSARASDRIDRIKRQRSTDSDELELRPGRFFRRDNTHELIR